jgi:hypothetical protein
LAQNIIDIIFLIRYIATEHFKKASNVFQFQELTMGAKILKVSTASFRWKAFLSCPAFRPATEIHFRFNIDPHLISGYDRRRSGVCGPRS